MDIHRDLLSLLPVAHQLSLCRHFQMDLYEAPSIECGSFSKIWLTAASCLGWQPVISSPSFKEVNVLTRFNHWGTISLAAPCCHLIWDDIITRATEGICILLGESNRPGVTVRSDANPVHPQCFWHVVLVCNQTTRYFAVVMICSCFGSCFENPSKS